MSNNPLQENKMGVMPVGKLLVNMALPMIISMLVQALYNVVDSIYVSQISESAVTALSLAFPVQNMQIGFAVGIGVGINSPAMLKGFLSGLHAGNFDITNVFIDNLYKTIGDDTAAGEEFVAWCAKFAADNNMEITITISQDPSEVSEGMKQYL